MAEDVSNRGPVAWRDHLANGPNFFMASEGRLVFADSAALDRGLVDLTATIAKIDLTFGKDLRVEALTPTLAMVAASYHEVLVDKTGKRVKENGYFTGLAEKGPAGWKFRNAHWSVAAAPVAGR